MPWRVGDNGLDTMGGRIRYARQNLGMTQVELGDAVGVLGQQVHRWEVGTHLPKITNVIDLAEILGVTLDWLATGELP